MKLIQTFTYLLVYFFCATGFSQTPLKLSTDQYEFVEGPVWDGAEFIYFTDIPNSKVIKYSVLTNTFSVAFGNSNRGNGLMFNKDFQLLVCEGSSGKITKRTISGDILETLVSTYKRKRFNGPNDLCVDAKGGIYFTDPNFESTSQKKTRVYYRNSLGVINVLDVFGDNKPNGVIISPDGTNLYVNDSHSTTIYRYDINETTGLVSNRINFAELIDPDNSNITGADGMAIDINGNLYVTAKFTVQIFNESGSLINTINFPEKATNCTFGKADKNTLYVTAGKNLYSVDFSNVTGVQHPFDLPQASLDVLDILDPLKEDINLYPNPIVNNTIAFELDENIKIQEVNLYTINGEQVEVLDFGVVNSELKITFNSLVSSGVYFVSINTSTGNITKKVTVYLN